jgi:hypothetical protein
MNSYQLHVNLFSDLSEWFFEGLWVDHGERGE